MTLRILFDVHPRIWGGTETFTARLVRHLDGRFESHIYASAKANAVRELAKESLRAVTPPAGGDGLAFVRALLIRRRIDVVQAQHVNSPLALAAKSLGKPVVWRVAGHIDEIMKGSPADARKRALAIVGMVADRIVCPSRFLAGQFGGLSGGVPVSVIHNGIDVRGFARHANAKRSKSGPLRVGLIGHLIPQKRHGDLLAAARILLRRGVNASFHIFGKPYPSTLSARYAARLMEAAGRRDLAARVSIGSAGADKFAIFSRMDVMVFPGLNEGCSNAILETMALGLPVVAADSGGNPELIEDGKTGLLVPPKDPRRLADAILSIAADPKRRARIGDAARARARRDFDIAACAKRYGDLYESLTGGR